VLSNIYLDKLDKELEARGLAFVRYADDFVIFTRSHKSAERVMKSVTGWIERKLLLKVSPTKTHIVPPSKSECGNIKATVATAYKILPRIIKQ
jgi:retron-type reverse transcriptase